MQKIVSAVFFLLLLASCSNSDPVESSSTSDTATESTGWHAVMAADSTKPHPRHEAAFVSVDNKYYLLGGRGIKPVDIFDTKTQTWTSGAEPPIEIHHFQPVIYAGEIYLLGAMTGKYPGETPLPGIMIYNPDKDTWRVGAEIPTARRRGGAGAVLHNDKIYLVCGIIDGHRGGHVPWLDVYDPATNTWEQLPDAPRPRDHFQAVVKDNKLYSLAGRTTVAATNPFANTIGEVDVFDLTTNTWSTLPDTLPTLRAGNAAIVLGDDILVVGGESKDQVYAHSEVEALAVATGKWRSLDSLSRWVWKSWGIS